VLSTRTRNREMTKEKPIQTEANSELKDMVDLIGSVFKSLSKDAELSTILLDCNIRDSFAKMIDDAIKNPLQSTLTALNAIEKSTTELLNEAVTRYLDENKQYIKSVYRFDGFENVLHYSILLNEAGQENKMFMYSFLAEYEKNKLSARFPIIMQSIPLQIENEFEKEVQNAKFKRLI
jgi:hypothetical protein